MARVIGPLRAALREELRERVRGGRMLPGERLPTLRWLANRYGVSQATARNAVQDLVAEGVLTSIQGKGTFARLHPGHVKLAPSRTQAILIVMPLLPAVDRLGDLALARGFLISHHHSNVDRQDPAVERQLLEAAGANRLAGVVLTATPRPPTNSGLWRRLRDEGTKVLLTGRWTTAMDDEIFLLPDFVAGGRLAVTEAARRGATGICALVGAETTPNMLDRLHDEGVAAGLAGTGMAALPALPRPTVHRDPARLAALRAGLARLPAGTRVVCRGTTAALVARECLVTLGRAAEIGVTAVRGVYADEPAAGIDEVVYDLDGLVRRALDYVADTTLGPNDRFQQYVQPTFVASTSKEKRR